MLPNIGLNEDAPKKRPTFQPARYAIDLTKQNDRQ